MYECRFFVTRKYIVKNIIIILWKYDATVFVIVIVVVVRDQSKHSRESPRRIRPWTVMIGVIVPHITRRV